MSEKSTLKKSVDETEQELTGPWKQIQTAIWLFGLAILAWKGWWWPGILVLVAISGLFQAGVQLYFSRQDHSKEAVEHVAQLARERAVWLPSTCPSCGGPISVQTVQWTGVNSADCPYCSANLKPTNQSPA